jgi:hypothetical protein
MKASSCKAKARLSQQLVRDELLKRAPSLTENDIRSTGMGQSGVDIQLSEAALKVYPFAIEVKCQESLNIWAALKQADENKGKHTPILCFKRNRTEMFVALKFNDFLNLVGDEDGKEELGQRQSSAV